MFNFHVQILETPDRTGDVTVTVRHNCDGRAVYLAALACLIEIQKNFPDFPPKTQARVDRALEILRGEL